jgi:hypothetical protein
MTYTFKLSKRLAQCYGAMAIAVARSIAGVFPSGFTHNSASSQTSGDDSNAVPSRRFAASCARGRVSGGVRP